MKDFRLIVLALFLCSMTVFSQENNIKHIIVKGETISSIAQKYNVSTASIYQLNPNAKSTLQLNQVLLIPNYESKKTNDSATAVSEKTTEINHVVITKETLYGITKQFKTTAELLYKSNPQLETEGLKIGQTIVIPSKLTKKEIANLSNLKNQETVETGQTVTALTHQVKPKESLYVIAKMYGVSLKEIQIANPEIGNKGLSIGQTIVIPSNGKMPENVVAVEEIQSKAKVETVAKDKEAVPVIAEKATKENEAKIDSQIQLSEIIHEVLTKETKYGIAKKYGITVADLERQNPAIQQKMLVGSKLRIQVPTDKIEIETKAGVDDAKVIVQTEKQEETTKASVNGSNADLIDQIVQFASDNIGVKYRSGGTTSAGFDCSGLICTAFGAYDIKLPRSSIEQASTGEKINNENAQKGDLIFFRTNGRSHINHVGMVVEVVDDEIKFIHSSTHSGVIISSTKEAYYQRNFAQVNRVVK
jgi:cell wall-associated NlpC family hydrolase